MYELNHGGCHSDWKHLCKPEHRHDTDAVRTFCLLKYKYSVKETKVDVYRVVY